MNLSFCYLLIIINEQKQHRYAQTLSEQFTISNPILLSKTILFILLQLINNSKDNF